MAAQQRPRTQESRSAAAQAQLVSAAIAVLADEGFARATTSAIATKAGVTTGALHHHFPTKESLFIAVLDELTEQALALFRNLGQTAVGRKAVARAILTELWSLYGSKRYWSVWEINMGYRGDESMHRRLVEHRGRTRELMYAALVDNRFLDTQTKAVLSSSLGFILSSLRGIFLDTFYASGDDNLLRRQLDELVAVLEDRLAGASQQSRTQPPATDGATLG